MLQFANVFPDFGIVAPLVRQLSWTHFTIIISIKNNEKRQYYTHESIEERVGVKENLIIK